MHHWFFLLVIFLTPLMSSAQLVSQGAHYRSELDDALTIRRISILPVSDNVSGIYSRPVEKTLIDEIKAEHRWDFRESGFVGPVPSLEEIENSPERIQRLTQGSSADALVMARVLRGPAGISLKMNLFLVSDQRLLAQETAKDLISSEISQVQNQAKSLLRKLLQKIPYDGLVLSRRNQRVTLNLGTRDGLQADQVISAIQILKTHRHPKFDFLISTEKEILGQIKILKAEDTLSFGSIITEKERGTIQKGTKLIGTDPVSYPAPESLKETSPSQRDESERLKNDVVFGKGAREWVPQTPPTFGRAGIHFGFGSYTGSTTLNSAGALDSDSSFFPTIAIEAEMWLNPSWALDFQWSQGIVSSDNPLSGSSPSDLSHSTSAMGLFVAYNFLLQGDFFGPKIQLLGGFGRYSDDVDDSDPRTLTSVVYSGPSIGLRGMMPVTPDRLWEVGLHFNLLLFSSLEEDPVTSGADSSSSVNDFKFFVNRKIGEKLILTGRLNFLLTRADFDGDGTRTDDASSTSQRTTTLTAGVTYLF